MNEEQISRLAEILNRPSSPRKIPSVRLRKAMAPFIQEERDLIATELEERAKRLQDEVDGSRPYESAPTLLQSQKLAQAHILRMAALNIRRRS